MEWIRTSQGILVFVLLWITLALTAPPNTGSFVATECYGSVLKLGCSRGHRIKVLDDFFGVSPRRAGPGQCRYQPGDCTVTNSRFTSVIHRYCEGKQTCTNFQVDRRHCGANHTNYEQVEYECVPDSQITDICQEARYKAPSGYISTPNFPHEYPPNMDCACAMRAQPEDVRIRLEATHFIVKFDSPCKDWLEIRMNGRTRRLCGAYKSTLKGGAFNLTFHSDQSQGHQGVWMYYSVYPRAANASVEVHCSRITLPTTTTTQLPPSSPPSSSSTNAEGPVLPQPPSGDNSLNLGQNVTKPPGANFPVDGTTNDAVNNSSSQSSPEESFGNEIDNFPDDNADSGLFDGVVMPGHMTEVNFVSSEIRRTTLRVLGGDGRHLTASADGEYRLSAGVNGGYYSNNTYQRGISALDKTSFEDAPNSQTFRNRDSNKTTGIIIISICVGGIVMLAFILAIIMCIQRRRQPKRVAAKERKRRLQQRLNSLSFYDSIPLYDSVGRRSGTTMVRLPGLTVPAAGGAGNRSDKGRVCTLPSEPSQASSRPPSQLDVKSLPWIPGTGTPWTPSPEPETDRDSAIYAELDKHSRGGATSEETLSPMPRTTPNGEGPPGYALHLKHTPVNKEDIYTHV